MTKTEKKDNKLWFAIYTKARCEKKTHHYLTLKGIHSYCPLNRVKKQYSDRKKWVEEVLFTSYLFVCITEKEKSEVRLTSGVINFVYIENKPAVIANNDILKIKKFLNEHENVTIEKYNTEDIKIGQRVKIDAGIFMTNEATVVKVMKEKAIVKLESLRVKLVAEVAKTDLIKI